MQQSYIPLILFVAGVGFFARFFQLAARLSNERTGSTKSSLERWMPWLPGTFTPKGEKLRQRMNIHLVIGWALLIAGILLSGR